jgi:EmrB/QacA subfamily drug resistance transporter
VLGVLGLTQLVVVLDAFIINVALPTVERELALSAVGRGWVIAGYSLAFGALLPLGGRLVDALGPRRALAISVVGFGAASALAGAAQGSAMFIAARCAQGAFAAVLSPASQAMVVATFPEERERSRAFGIFGAVGALGGAVGMTLGGTLTDYVSWRWTMYINVIFAVLIIGGMLRWTSRLRSVERRRMDLAGTMLITVGLLAVGFGLSRAGETGWTARWTIAALVAGTVLCVVFFLAQAQSRDPLLPPVIFRHRDRAGAFVAMFVLGFASVAEFVFLSFYLQQVGGYSVTAAGLAYLPLIAAQVVTTAVVLRHATGVAGPRLLISGGLALVTAGLLVLTRIGPAQSYLVCALPGILLTGLGFGMLFAIMAHVIVAEVAPGMVGIASATGTAINSVGTSMAAPLLGTVSAAMGTGADLGTGYVASLWVAAAVCAVGAVLAAALFRPGPLHRRAADSATISGAAAAS